MKMVGGIMNPKKTVMIVDDSPLILEVIGDILKPEGYGVIKAQSGDAALKMLKSIKPDLILLDFFMPGMSGREVCEKMRADSKLKNIKVVFLTAANFSQKGEMELKQMGILDNIQKPFDNKDLVDRVKKLLK